MLTLIMLGTSALTLGLAFLIVRAFDRTHQVARLHCDTKDRDVQVDLLVRPKRWNFGDDYDIARCSAFDDPRRVTCDKHCLNPLVTSIHRT